MANITLNNLLNTTNTNSSATNVEFTVGAEKLYPALVECFGIISLGYLAGR